MARRKKSRSRKVRLDPRQVETLERQREAFREKFGRDPGPDDPVFFDPKANESRPLDEEWLVAAVAAAMEKAGIDPAKIHAYRRTGMLVTPQNLDQWSANDLVEWEAALDEYDMLAARRNCMSQGVLVPVRHRVYLLASHSTATRMRLPPTHLHFAGALIMEPSSGLGAVDGHSPDGAALLAR